MGSFRILVENMLREYPHERIGSSEVVERLMVITNQVVDYIITQHAKISCRSSMYRQKMFVKLL